MHREQETVGLLQDTKEALWENGHPVLRQLREVKGILFEEEELPSSAISLKKLFSRRQMDENHVDCLILYRIALGMLRILEELSRRRIYPGLIDLGDCYVDLRSRGCDVFVTRPQRFQILHYEQDYEWFPEDERLLGAVELFDEVSQKKADVRLLYKILVASSKGNIKLPPKMTESDYSELFYRTLPDQWKSIFEGAEEYSYEEMEQLLIQSVEMEEAFAMEARERLHEKAEKKAMEKPSEPGPETGEKKQLFCMIVLLRTELEEAGKISPLLYRLQDELELETKLTGFSCRQSFVFGNGAVALWPFQTYAVGYRCQCEQQIKEYSAGEALIVAADFLLQTMEQQAGGEYRMYVVVDGKLENDKIFQASLTRLEQLKRRGGRLELLSAEDSQCEACLRLEELAGNMEG